MAKTCRPGYYYCYTDKKCKKIPLGWHVGRGGVIEKDSEDTESKNGNGNGESSPKNGNGNGNGGSNGNGGNGGGVSEEKKDHEYSMARSQLKTIKNAASRLEKKMGKKGEGELKAWVQSKITKSADYIDTAADYVTNEGTLHKWFKGSKSKDGKGGWVNVVTGGTCASDKPGEGTPKCVSSAKRASMSKAERLSAQRRKKKADPGQQQKTGAAKPTYVSTDKKEEVELTDAYGETFAVIQDVIQTEPMKSNAPSIDSYETYDIEAMTEEEKMKDVKGIAKELDKAVDMHKSQAKRLRKAGVSEENMAEGSDKKGKGSGSKDACYHKVKSRYSVWPSAYASGALVKCRKVGAANWGNSTKKEEFSDWRSELNEKCWAGYEKKGMKTMFGKRYPNCVKKTKKEEVEIATEGKSDGDPCWDTHKQVGMKKKGGKMVPNCVPKEEVEIEEAARIPAQTGNIISVMVSWRGKGYSLKMFFPQAKRPTKQEVELEVQKVYPDGRVRYMEVSDLKPGEQLLQVTEGAAWTKKSGKNQSGGLNEKGRKSYERENPGSDLKRPSKKVGNPRRKSFCARMKGMKAKLTSAKTARDPDSRINKSLRAWNC